jgi:uncharacterized protein (DUF342 family)
VPKPRLSIRIASEGLTAFLSVAAGPPMLGSELDAEIESSGIKTGILADTRARIAMALGAPDFACPEALLATGLASQPGCDAWLELAFVEGLQPGHLREDGSFDYHDRELLKPVCQGDVLGAVHPAVPGIAGQRVDGTSISVAPARDLSLQLLSGVELGADLVVRAARDGVILYKAGQSLDVVERHVHQGPVDLHSGNLHMQGSLTVKGDVLRPFSAVATGDVEILGNVDSGTVHAGGCLRIRGGVRGGDGGAVGAEGDLTLHHAESAELHSGGQLRVQESVNSRLVAAQIHASGRVRGGSAVAETRIVMKEAGAANGVDTRLAAGEPLELPLAEARRLIATSRVARQSERTRGRSDERGKGGKAGRARAELDASEVQRLALRAKRRDSLLESACIELGIAHPGVSIRIGDAHTTLDESTKSTRFYLDRESTTLRIEKMPP